MTALTQVHTTQNPSTEREKGTQSPTPNQELIALVSWECENHFSPQTVSLGASATLKGKAPHSGVVGQHKMNTMFFVYSLFCFPVFFDFFQLFSLSVLSFWRKRKKNMKLGGWGGGKYLGGVGGEYD